MDVTQTEHHIHHGTRTTARQEHGRCFAEEVSAVSQRQGRNRPLTMDSPKRKQCKLFSGGKQESTSDGC